MTINTERAAAHEVIRKIIMDEEGGLVLTDNKNDSGGLTFAGVTFATFKAYRQKQYLSTITEEEFREDATSKLQYFVDDIYEIYYTMFYAPLQGGWLPVELHEMALSCIINCGAGGFGKILQRTYNKFVVNAREVYPMLATDGVIGKVTRGYVESLMHNITTAEFRAAFIDEWIRHYINIVQANASKLALGQTNINQAANLEGWFNRATSHRYKG